MIFMQMANGSNSNFMNEMMGGNGQMSGGMLIFGLFWLVFVLLLITVLVLSVAALMKYLSKGTNVQSQRAAIHALKERYAKGEINREEFNKMKADLEDKK